MTQLTLTNDMPVISNSRHYDPCVKIVPLHMFTDHHEKLCGELFGATLESCRTNGGLTIPDAMSLFNEKPTSIATTYQAGHDFLHNMIVNKQPLEAQIKTPEPIPMRMPCPACGVLHIDRGERETKPHHTHACQSCGNVWRPAVVNTVGVQFLPGFKNDNP